MSRDYIPMTSRGIPRPPAVSGLFLNYDRRIGIVLFFYLYDEIISQISLISVQRNVFTNEAVQC